MSENNTNHYSNFQTQNIDWGSWFKELMVTDSSAVRDNFLESQHYEDCFFNYYDGLATDVVNLNESNFLVTDIYGDSVPSLNIRLKDLFNLMTIQYSAGAEVSQLHMLMRPATQWLEEFAVIQRRYNKKLMSEQGRILYTVAMHNEDYWFIALRMVCFSLLLGYADNAKRIMAVLDEYEQPQDGLLERLVRPFIDEDRGELPDKAHRHLPYRKLFKVFAAEPEKRAKLMATYLDEWYEASRREPYVEQHGYELFLGYWSWEAAAVTWLLGIDDTSYREHQFYPADMVDFAKSFYNQDV